MTGNMLRVAIIGAGRIGKVHAQAIASHPRAELVVVSDPFGTAAEDLAAAHGARAVKDADEVFAADDVDAVIIGSPTPLHAQQVLAATRAGKAVLCEKPVASSVAEARELEAELATFDHPPVMVGFQRRYDPSIKKARDLVADGEIGRVEQMTIQSRDPAAPPASYIAQSGGIFKDCTIHDFDQARFFMGDIVEVTAFGQQNIAELADTGDFDGAVVVLRSADGAIASITNNRHCAAGYDQRMEVHGEKGSLFVDNLRPTSVTVNKLDYSAAKDPYLDYFLERYADAYRDELTAFIDAINEGADVSPDVADGITALVLAEAAEESARSGRPVKINN